MHAKRPSRPPLGCRLKTSVPDLSESRELGTPSRCARREFAGGHANSGACEPATRDAPVPQLLQADVPLAACVTIRKKRMTQRVDYDLVAARYDQRYEAHRFDGMEAVLQRFVGDSRCLDVAEVGCGTGHWLAGLQQRVRTAAGLDVSAEMLQRVRTAAPFARVARRCPPCGHGRGAGAAQLRHVRPPSATARPRCGIEGRHPQSLDQVAVAGCERERSRDVRFRQHVTVGHHSPLRTSTGSNRDARRAGR